MIQISRNRQIQKNIKQNLKFYRDPIQEASDIAQGMLYKIIMLILGISVAVASILGSVNIIFRIPDFFRYEFERMEVSSKLDLGISGTDLGSFFSKFMLHSNDAFSLRTEYEGIETALFDGTDAALMDNFRFMLDMMLVAAVVALILTIVGIVFLYINRLAKNLRVALNIALGIYVAAVAGLAVYFNVYDGDIALRNAMMDGEFGADDLLRQMFDGQFILDTTVAIAVISFIIMMIIRYIVWRMTAQKGIFSEGLIGVAK